ncbi:MAG: hypothetical protein IIW16_03855 [Clostridia bacterium]|jgi:hypothetical protein|nr:hypothetical protein [Clostridia bacterium]MBQ5798930.1 hypothetical protein [Clostridia bacterium]MEE1277861.1 hypothetical protein [Acutalibacteraceae bacterium]
MIKLIIGNKGSGKTKKLIDMVNTTAAESNGSVVCVELGDTLTFNISHKVRLIDVKEYSISGYGEYYALLSGICAGNHDVTHVFGDATLRIGTRDYEELADFLARVKELSAKNKAEFIFTISCDESELPARVFETAEKI